MLIMERLDALLLGVVLLGACGGGGGGGNGGVGASDGAPSAALDGGLSDGGLSDGGPTGDAGPSSAVRALCEKYVGCGCSVAFMATTVDACEPQLRAYFDRFDARYGTLHRDEPCFEALVTAISTSETCSFVHPGCYAWTGDLAEDEACDPSTRLPASSCGRGLRCPSGSRQCTPVVSNTRNLCDSLGYVGQ